MNNWWSRLSLKNKLQIPIQLILLIMLVLIQRIALDKFEVRVLEEAKQKAEVSADGVLNGLNMLMINGIISNMEQRKLYVDKMAASERILELRVVRNKPVQDQFGPGLPTEQAKDDMDRLALSSKNEQVTRIELAGKHALRVVVPFIAQTSFRGTNCLKCHNVPAGTVNGAASITLDLSEEYAVLKQVNIAIWVAQIAAQAILYLLIGWLINLVIRPTRELQKVMQTMQADGDLSKRVAVRSQDEIGKTARSFNDLANSFQVIVSQVEGHSKHVATAANSLARDAEELAQSSQKQSDTAAVASSAVEQVSTSGTLVAEGANRVAQMSAETLERANSGQASLQEMVQELDRVEGAVKEIATSVGEFVNNTQNITSMTQQVRDIAEQTNLLALNAAIEAARAGEQGRGFAVVADEVRKLAEKSAHSASQIDEVTQLLGTQSGQVEKTVQRGMTALQSSQDRIREVAGVLTESNASVDKVNRGLEEITQSINRQRDATQEIARNVEQIAMMAKHGNSVVKRTVTAVKSLVSQSESLGKTVGRFKV